MTLPRQNGEESERSPWPSSLRARLLLGLAIAVVIPLLLFAWLGDRELRRSTKENLIAHLMRGLSRQTAVRLDTWLERVESTARVVCSIQSFRGILEDSGDPLDFTDWYLRAGSEVQSLGDILLVARRSNGSLEIVFHTQNGRAQDLGPAQKRLSGPARLWVEQAEAEASVRFFAPIPDPFASRAEISRPLDPSRYVLPYVVPLHNDMQIPVGCCVFLLPFDEVQQSIQESREVLRRDWSIPSGEVFLLDARSDRFLLHTDRGRIGALAKTEGVAGFREEGDRVLALEDVGRRLSLPWRVGARALGQELFRSVDKLASFFYVLIVLLLSTTLGFASFFLTLSIRPLRRLEKVTEELGKGRLETRAEVTGPRELRTLAGAVNTMAGQLEQDRERQRQAERDRAWTKMARQVAHEIKNPLQPVRLHGELIERTIAKGRLEEEEQKRILNSAGVILRQVDALQRIVADFSEFAEAGLPPKESIRFVAGDVIRELEALYAARDEGSIRLDFRSEADALQFPLLGSPLRLQQVLVNLIKNAIEASEENAAEQVELCARVEGSWIVLSVLDRGPGLEALQGEEAFTPYFSTKKGGTGLGLAICSRNVESMGGRIVLEARDGGGAHAELRLPKAAPAGE